MLVNFIPLTGVSDVLFIFHNCLLYSLYSFEYKWVQMGWPLNQRLSFLESNWPYFVGFGLPLTLLTWWPGDFFISGCVFSILFPIFIVSGNEAEPVANIG
jgi:etoposide-induced 2.4 mRNA